MRSGLLKLLYLMVANYKQQDDAVSLIPSHLRFAVEEYPPYTYLRGEGKEVQVWGPMRDIIHDITQMMGCSYSFERPADHGFGSLSSAGEWSGMVGLTYRNETDMIVGPMAMTSLRKTAIDYSFPFVVDYMGILQSRPTKQMNPVFFAEALDWRAWILLLICCFVVSITLAVFTYVDKNAHYPVHQNPATTKNVFKNIYSLLPAIFLQGHISLSPYRDPYRLLVGVWCICTFVVGVAFSQQMIAMMAVPRVKPIETINDLLNAEGYGIIMETDTVYTQAFSDATSGSLKDLWDKKSVRGKEVIASELRELMIDGMLRDNWVVVGDKAILKRFTSASVRPENEGYCDFYFSKEEFFPLNFAMGFNKQMSPILTPIFNERLNKLVETGIWSQLIKRAYPKLDACLIHPSKEKVSVGLTSISAFQGIFYILVVGHALSLCVFIGEHLWKLQHR